MRERSRVDKFVGPTTPWHDYRPQNMSSWSFSGRKNHRRQINTDFMYFQKNLLSSIVWHSSSFHLHRPKHNNSVLLETHQRTDSENTPSSGRNLNRVVNIRLYSPTWGIWFIPSCQYVSNKLLALWNVPFSGVTNRKQVEVVGGFFCTSWEAMLVTLPTLSPSEMATHELQCVMVWRRYVEHQTLETIHFVHVVRHLCSTR